MNTGGVSKPSTRTPISSLIDRLNGPRTRRMPLLAQPLLGGREQRREGFLPVLRVEHPEEARRVVVAFEMQRVDLRADPPDRLLPAPGDPCLPSGVLEVGVAPGRQMEAPFDERAAGSMPGRKRRSGRARE